MERAWCDEYGVGIWLKLKSQPEMTFLKAGESSFVTIICSGGRVWRIKWEMGNRKGRS